MVGTFVFSVQDDIGYRLLVERLVGAYTVMRYAQGQTVMADIAVGRRALPTLGAVTVGGAAYLVTTIEAQRFPSGTLRISLLFPRPPSSTRLLSCAQIRANVAGTVAHRVFLRGPHRTGGGDRTRGGARLRDPSGRASRRATSARSVAPRSACAPPRTSRACACSPDGSVIADVGDREPLIAPNRVALYDGAGALIGRVVVSVQSVHGFVGVAST